MSTTLLTDEQIMVCLVGLYEKHKTPGIGNLRVNSDFVPLGRAIEQAVLQSEQVQALRKDIAEYVHIAAEQATEIEALLGLLKESRQQLPLAAQFWNEDDEPERGSRNVGHIMEMIARIDDAMEKQP